MTYYNSNRAHTRACNINNMDESWRIRMGMSTAPPPIQHIPHHPARRSTEDTISHRRKPISDYPLDYEDFNDVFGGPPRTILSRQFSTGIPRSSSSTSFFYEEVFQPAEKPVGPFRKSGRNLPVFRIPYQQQREKNFFYSDIFGWDEERIVRSRSRSKASSSSVLSSEELSPLRPPTTFEGGDDEVSCFASNLRPINVRSRWNPRRTVQEDYQKQKATPPPFSSIIHNTEKDFHDHNYPFGLSRRNASPETISLEPISNRSFQVSTVDLELNSPSSPLSSVCEMTHGRKEDRTISVDQDEDEEEDEDEDEAMSRSYHVIEIISGDNREGTCESNDVDEAIAWAKEKFQMDEKQDKGAVGEGIRQFEATEPFHFEHIKSCPSSRVKSVDAELSSLPLSKAQIEIQMLDEKIRLWSTGKETDIRLLLSSLHHILWPNSGWSPTPLTNIIEISLVKKAYQKAQLCLHPDKLQQRGATLQQKYIADKAFYILQDAWAAFLSSGF